MSVPERSPLIKKMAYEKFDGAVWYQFESNNSLIILTAAGKRLLKRQRLAPILGNYAKDYSRGTSRDDDTRRFLVAGWNSHVFTLDDQAIVIKEAKQDGELLWPALERMDKLANAVEQNGPDWIATPEHYGLLVPKRDVKKQFLMLQKINSGVTVGDVLDVGRQGAPPERQTLRDEALSMFGGITRGTQEEVRDRFDRLLVELRGALLRSSLSPREYLPDIDNNAYNVVLEQVEEPVDGSNLKYWVIDQ